MLINSAAAFIRVRSPISRGPAAVLAAALILLAPLGASAEAAPDSITAGKAVEAALASNIAVKSATIESRIKKRSSDWSLNKFLPTMSLSATDMRLNNINAVAVAAIPSTGQFVTYQPKNNNVALGLTIQEVFSAVNFGLMDQAAIDYQRSAISKAQAEKSVAAAVKKIFYQLIVQDQAIELTRSRLDTAKERLRQAKLLYDLGQGTELNYHYATMNVESLTPDLRAMETGRAAALTAFQEMLGYDANPAMALEGSLDDVAISVDDLPISEGDRFDVRLSRQNEKQLESALKIQRYAFLPNLVVRYTADPTINGPWETNSTTGEKIDFWDKDNWSQSSGGFSITISWDLSPLLPFSSIRAGKAELQDRLELAREATAQAIRAARDDAGNQLRAIKDSADKISNLTKVAESSKRAFELTSAAYQLGTGRILDLQDAEVAWQGARIQLLNERLKIATLAFDFEAKYQTMEIKQSAPKPVSGAAPDAAADPAAK
jgi:outer membrane protein TolC